jgi:uncharacterized protein YcnI
MVVKINIVVFWVVALCSFIGGYHVSVDPASSKDGSTYKLDRVITQKMTALWH